MLENLNPLMPIKKEIWITEDQDKANELAKFYSDIFTIEVDEGPIVSLQTATVCDDIDLTEKLILEKLNSLDLSKSSGPDLLHPRVLYEVRHKIVYPLKSCQETGKIVQ